MGLRIKDIIAIALVTFVSMPVIYLLMLFATGNARIEFSAPPAGDRRAEALKTIPASSRSDSLIATHSRSFVALTQERQELVAERERLAREAQRVELIRRELEEERERLTQERQRLGDMVQQVDSLDQRRIRQLAKVYEAMRPLEAAQILETQSTGLVIRILRAMGDDRQKGKIMGALPRDKAAVITRVMGSAER